MGLFSSELLESFQIVDWGYTEELNPHSFAHYENWVESEQHGSLGYLSDHRKEARKSLKEVFPECQSAIVFLFSYAPQRWAAEEFYRSDESNGLRVASYVTAFDGDDYHKILGHRLNTLGEHLNENGHGPIKWRMSLDIQPVLERDLAYRSGLGWFGKNSMLINRHHGSFLMIGSLLLDKKFAIEKRKYESDHCGQCRACIEACPTDALVEGQKTLIAEKCISTFTIEHFKEVAAPAGMENGQGEIFGCDICQDVCPWNLRPLRLGLKAASSEEFQKKNEKILKTFLRPDLATVIEKVASYSSRGFAKEFRDTPLGRTGKRGLLKNLKFWKNKA